MPANPTGIRSLQIALAAPIRPGTTSGNSVTAARWADQLTSLGHTVQLVAVDEAAALPPHFAPRADLVVVLHARRCATAAQTAKADRPDRPLVVALAGTDLYQDLPDHAATCESLQLADALVVLQDDGIEHLTSMNEAWGAKAQVVNQSVQHDGRPNQPDPDHFSVVVLSYLRDVKDPLLAARAARLLPDSSTVRVLHAGDAHTDGWAARATAEQASNERYTWLGELDREAAADLLARAHVLACTSLLEGGANVVSEAIAAGVAVIGTNIGGNRGLLGPDHPGLVPVGDEHALAKLITSLEHNPDRLETLRQRSVDRQWMASPDHEKAQWQHLINRLT